MPTLAGERQSEESVYYSLTAKIAMDVLTLNIYLYSSLMNTFFTVIQSFYQYSFSFLLIKFVNNKCQTTFLQSHLADTPQTILPTQMSFTLEFCHLAFPHTSKYSKFCHIALCSGTFNTVVADFIIKLSLEPVTYFRCCPVN